MKQNQVKKAVLLTCLFFFVSLGAFAQNLTVKGVVKDASGESIIGANVLLVSDNTVGTITDIDGNFTLENIPDGSLLEIRYIGYISQQQRVEGNKFLSITLKEDTQTLDEAAQGTIVQNQY